VEDDEGGYYFAYLPDWGWSTISTTSDTMEQVLVELDRMKRNVIKYFWENGKPIPEASLAPFEIE
jgi:predicted RNase H-like HicB family nuclease